MEIRLTCQVVDGRKLFLGFARDTSERVAARLAQEELRNGRALRQHAHRIEQQHGRLTLAARVGGLGVWDYDLLHDVLACDERWYRIMGRDPAQPVRTVTEFCTLVHPEDVERATEVDLTAAQLVANGQHHGIGFRIVRPDGAVRWMRSAACLINDLGGAAQRAVGFVVDITETRFAAERLEQSHLAQRQAMEALRSCE